MTTTPFDHRLAQVTFTLIDADGRPLPDHDVVVEQRSHAFGFGTIGFDFVPPGDEPGAQEIPRTADLWLDVFNTATLPFYWGLFEPQRGRPRTRQLRQAAQWFTEHGCRVKGHPLVWHTLTADWLRDLPTDEVETAVRERIRREVTGFADVIQAWDVVNEAVIMPKFVNEPHRNAITRLAAERGRIATVQFAFAEARAAGPTATLLLNDFDMSEAYERLIEGVLGAGVQVDAIGLQSHMHQGYWGEERTLATVDRFARFGLPIHMTETTLVSGDLMPPHIEDLNDYQVPSWPTTAEGEQRQAGEMVRHYRALLSHPSVQAVTYWGWLDEGAWLGAPSGFIRTDGTPKPAYEALRNLVKGECWLAPTSLRTDPYGRLEVRGFPGDYQLSSAAGATSFTVGASASDVHLRLEGA
ncbi:endo-1,4-beta-xylanase [Paractinoplanes brasiliensis]|uniref:Beta-xylanase n=1 Tax=Paractinoplanes brasiliensis TaxID=52695 RepID=A0A4R6JBR2_9ACTN|nr:endo-1,4-beta-xylanase [Actinoplanes brasiliensis]TDO33174.1 GH35 family endo-1,4-beta-xylanase [Actinoplanes brasiliensis]GID33249.1 beta-xylanase [Actinoplanes brasiliensis]